MANIYKGALGLIGNTPLVELTHIEKAFNLEAKILAKPIVATAYPTVRDQIRNANEGVIVELSVDGIYKGLKEMVFDKTKQKEISNYLENHEYGNQTEIKKYIKLIEGE